MLWTFVLLSSLCIGIKNTLNELAIALGMAVTVHRSEVNGSQISNFGIRWSCASRYSAGHSLRQGKETPFPVQKVRRRPEPIRTKLLKEMSPVSKEIEPLPCRPSSHSVDIILIKLPTSNLGITKEKRKCLLALCIAMCVLPLCVL